jgi:predicted RNase H-like HicB family nuclease
MKQQIANYTVIIKKELRTGTNQVCYCATVPTLDVATEADSLEQVQIDIDNLVKFHLQSLAEEGEEIPSEPKFSLITRLETLLPAKARLIFS